MAPSLVYEHRFKVLGARSLLRTTEIWMCRYFLSQDEYLGIHPIRGQNLYRGNVSQIFDLAVLMTEHQGM